MQRILGVSLLFLPFAWAVACSSSGGDSSAPSPTGTVDSPGGLHVSAALASVHLGDEKCTHDESADVAAQSCAAPLPDAGPPKGTGLCGGPCDFSSVQIAFTAGKTGTTAHVSVLSGAIVDASTGAELQSLTASTPLVWNGTKYQPWDETIAASSELKASYTLSPPAWSTFDRDGSYERQYKVRIVVRLDGGAPVTLESQAVTRDPPVAT